MSTPLNTAAVALLALCVGSSAFAETERYGILGIQNDTGNVTIHFEVKIGDGPWQAFTLRPGQGRTFWHEYANQNDRTSPPTAIRFNSAIDNNKPFPIQYDLQHYAAPDKLPQYAKKYSFQKDTPNYF